MKNTLTNFIVIGSLLFTTLSTPILAVEPISFESHLQSAQEKIVQRQQEIDSKYQEVIVKLREKQTKYEDLFSRLEQYQEHHYPVIEGQQVLPIPYLTLPFREADVGGHYDITEGWIYSDEETAIHGFTAHNGIDFAITYGTPVVAPADGYALSSYHTFWIRNDDGSIRTYQGKPLRF